MPAKRRQSVGEAGPGSKRGKQTHSDQGEASSLLNLGLHSSLSHERCGQHNSMANIDTQGHPSTTRVIQSVETAQALQGCEGGIRLTEDTPSSKLAATSRAQTPVEAYDTCFGMVYNCLSSLSSKALLLTLDSSALYQSCLHRKGHCAR